MVLPHMIFFVAAQVRECRRSALLRKVALYWSKLLMSRTQSSSFPGLAPSLCRICSTSDVVIIEDLLMQGTGKGEA